MRITTNLSREFYERFGDQVVDELVNLLNEVGDLYRSDLRELNETNFARFDDRLERRFAEFDAKWDTRFAEFEVKQEARLAGLSAQLVTLDAKWESRIGDLRAELIKWMFLFWLGSIATMLTLGRLLIG